MFHVEHSKYLPLSHSLVRYVPRGTLSLGFRDSLLDVGFVPLKRSFDVAIRLPMVHTTSQGTVVVPLVTFLVPGFVGLLLVRFMILDGYG